MTALSGTHDRWSPRIWPSDKDASAAIREFLSGESDVLYGIKLDFRGADLSGACLSDSWLTGADLRGVQLEDADLNATNATEARFEGARLARAELPKAALWHASFARADLSAARLVRVEAFDASFVGAVLRGADLRASSFDRADFTDADLTGCDLDSSFLANAVLAGATVAGARGLISGPVVVEVKPERRVLASDELREWFVDRGASVEVHNATTYYARLAVGRTRENPSGVLRRRRAGERTVDEAFTRNLRWEPTDYFDRVRLGHNDDEHVEITEAEAQQFVERLTAKLS